MLNAHGIIMNNSGELGQKFPDSAVRMALWEGLPFEIRQYLMTIEDIEKFEQSFVYECFVAGLIEALHFDEDEIENGEC